MSRIFKKILRVLAVFVAAIVLFSCDTDRNVTPPYTDYFLKYYGEDGNQQAVDMVVNDDNTFILLGSSSVGQGIILLKADENGKTLWTKKLGGSTDIPIDIEPTLDGKFVVLSNYQRSAGNLDITLIRVDGDGNKIDSVSHGTSANDYATSVTAVSDGGFIIAGKTEYNPQPPNRKSLFMHFRCNSSLVFYDDQSGLWHDIDGYGTDAIAGDINGCTKVYQNSSNSFYVFGYSNALTPSNTNNKIQLIYYQLTNEGDQAGVNFLGMPDNDMQSAFVSYVPPALLEGYFVVSTIDKGSSASKLRVSKLKAPLHSTGISDAQFDQNVLGTLRLEGISAAPSYTAPEGYLVVANQTDDKDQTRILLTKVNQSGDELWSTGYGANKNDLAAAVAELPNGKIVVLCTIQLDVQTKMALLKLNSTGQFLK